MAEEKKYDLSNIENKKVTDKIISAIDDTIKFGKKITCVRNNRGKKQYVYCINNFFVGVDIYDSSKIIWFEKAYKSKKKKKRNIKLIQHSNHSRKMCLVRNINFSKVEDCFRYGKVLKTIKETASRSYLSKITIFNNVCIVYKEDAKHFHVITVYRITPIGDCEFFKESKKALKELNLDILIFDHTRKKHYDRKNKLVIRKNDISNRFSLVLMINNKEKDLNHRQKKILKYIGIDLKEVKYRSVIAEDENDLLLTMLFNIRINRLKNKFIFSIQ